MNAALERVRALPIWRGTVDPEPMSGGLTNVNFKVRDRADSYVVRVGSDIVVHQIMRFNERAASEAAFRAGVSPEVVYAGEGVLVVRFIDGKTLGPADVRDPRNLPRIVELVKTVHRDMPRHLRGPALVFWPFYLVRDYAHTLSNAGSRHQSRLAQLLADAEQLERDLGPIDMVFGHNDLLAANLIDDGKRLWLIDWDYAGFNSPLFDLANLASNSELGSEQQEEMLALYHGRTADAGLKRRYSAMICASLLREAMWGMVAEIHSGLAVDYPAYTAEYLGRYERALAAHRTG
jgi:thiamine kinase-like enzyme